MNVWIAIRIIAYKQNQTVVHSTQLSSKEQIIEKIQENYIAIAHISLTAL